MMTPSACSVLLCWANRTKRSNAPWTLACAFSTIPTTCRSAPRHLWAGLTRSAKILASHLRAHPNKLLGLRLSVLFASFVLIRHLACLEACYVPGAGDRMIPFLLDFSEVDEEPVARASLMSYTLVCQSIARFYGWAFAQRLQAYTSLEGLAQEPPPLYRNRALSPEAAEIWQLAMVEVKQGHESLHGLRSGSLRCLGSGCPGQPHHLPASVRPTPADCSATGQHPALQTVCGPAGYPGNAHPRRG